MFAETPHPPYYAVIFTSILNNPDPDYAKAAEQMVQLAQQQEGFLGVESARETIGITVSYWESIEAIRAWKANSIHQKVQQKGKEMWYKHYHVRIAKVERAYDF